jgi:hypothetical protein
MEQFFIDLDKAWNDYFQLNELSPAEKEKILDDDEEIDENEID